MAFCINPEKMYQVLQVIRIVAECLIALNSKGLAEKSRVLLLFVPYNLNVVSLAVEVDERVFATPWRTSHQ